MFCRGWCIKGQECDFSHANLVNNLDLRKPLATRKARGQKPSAFLVNGNGPSIHRDPPPTISNNVAAVRTPISQRCKNCLPTSNITGTIEPWITPPHSDILPTRHLIRIKITNRYHIKSQHNVMHSNTRTLKKISLIPYDNKAKVGSPILLLYFDHHFCYIERCVNSSKNR